MAISRRKFLRAGIGVSLIAAIPFRVNAQQGRASAGSLNAGNLNEDLNNSFPTKALFSEYLNTTFWITFGTANAIEVELVAVNDLKHSSAVKEPAAAKRERYSLIFRGPKNTPLKQDTYTLKHNNLGTVMMFLVPMGTDKKGSGLRYEAIVSRLIS